MSAPISTVAAENRFGNAFGSIRFQVYDHDGDGGVEVAMLDKGVLALVNGLVTLRQPRGSRQQAHQEFTGKFQVVVARRTSTRRTRHDALR